MATSKRSPARELVLAAIDNARNSDRLVRAAVERSFQPNLIAGVDRELLAARTARLRANVSPHHVSYNALRHIARNRLSLTRSISFRAKIHESAESRYLTDVLRPAWNLDVKNHAYEFVDRIGARRPKSDKRRYSLAEVPMTFPGVLKATRATGSRGCYLLHRQDHIVHVMDGKTFASVEEMVGHAHGLMRASRAPIRDSWMWEEMILEDVARRIPARDLKFYAFYGEVVIMRESARVNDETKVAYWNADNVQTEMGHPQDYDFDRSGFTPEDAQLVSEISLQIPHPYVRIDMLKGEDGLVVGEFTPHPGNFDLFNDEWDRTLGEAWVRAESRLLRDLLSGKSFAPFVEATGLLAS